MGLGTIGWLPQPRTDKDSPLAYASEDGKWLLLPCDGQYQLCHENPANQVFTGGRTDCMMYALRGHSARADKDSPLTDEGVTAVATKTKSKAKTKPKASKPLLLVEKLARRLLHECGIEVGESQKFLVRKLNGLVDAPAPENAGMAKLLAAVQKALAAGRGIGIKGGQDKPPKEVSVNGKPRKREGMSCVDAAAKALEDSGKEMSAAEVLDMIIAKGWWKPARDAKTPINTVHARMTTEIKAKGKDSRFKKIGRGRFAVK